MCGLHTNHREGNAIHCKYQMGVAVFFDRASNHKRKILIGLLEAFHDEEGTLDAVVAKGELVELLCMRLQVRLRFLYHWGDDFLVQILGGEGEDVVRR